jgi:hypothetical protein
MVALAAMLAAPFTPAAGQMDVLVVLSKPEKAYAEVAESLKTTLMRDPLAKVSVNVTTLSDADWKLQAGKAAHFTVIVTVGAQAAIETTALQPKAVVLHTLIPRHTYLEITRTAAPAARRGATSAIYLDQPLARQLELVRQALPAHRRLAAVLGPAALDQLNELRTQAKDKGFELGVERITEAGQLQPALHRLLEEHDVLLSLADSLVFNSGTIHHLLLTSYRYRVPVVGLSRSYVEAGALLAVYSSPEQIGRQAAEIVLGLSGAAPALPAPQYPRYFSVAINNRVASSLGLRLPDEAELERRLQPTKNRH